MVESTLCQAQCARKVKKVSHTTESIERVARLLARVWFPAADFRRATIGIDRACAIAGALEQRTGCGECRREHERRCGSRGENGIELLSSARDVAARFENARVSISRDRIGRIELDRARESGSRLLHRSALVSPPTLEREAIRV